MKAGDPRKKRLSLVRVIPLLFISFGLVMWGNYHFLTDSLRYANRDFMSIWGIGRAVLEGLDPYDTSVWGALRERYGSSWIPSPLAPYPLWTGVVFAPLALFDLDVSSALWLTMSEVLLGASLFFLLVHYEEIEMSVAELVVITLGAFLSRWSTLTFHTGQMTLFLLVGLVAFLVFAKRERPFLAGVVLAFVTLKPTPFILFVPLLGSWLIVRRHWKVIAGGFTGVIGLLVISWAVQPGWLASWLFMRNKALRAPYQMPTVWGLSYEITHTGWPLLGLFLVILLVSVLGYFILTRRKLGEAEVVSLAIAASIFVTPYAWAYEHAYLFLPMVFFYSRVREYRFAPLFWILLCTAFPWLFYWAAMQRGIDTLSGCMPLIVGFTLFFLITRSERKFERGARSSEVGQ